MAEKRKKPSKDLIYFVVVLPALIILSIVGLLFLEKVAEERRPICKFLGNEWLIGSPTDPSVRHGCFTYQELYE